MRQEKETEDIRPGKEEVKSSLLADDMSLCIEDSKDLSKQLSLNQLTQ